MFSKLGSGTLPPQAGPSRPWLYLAPPKQSKMKTFCRLYHYLRVACIQEWKKSSRDDAASLHTPMSRCPQVPRMPYPHTSRFPDANIPIDSMTPLPQRLRLPLLEASSLDGMLPSLMGSVRFFFIFFPLRLPPAIGPLRHWIPPPLWTLCIVLIFSSPPCRPALIFPTFQMCFTCFFLFFLFFLFSNRKFGPTKSAKGTKCLST